LDHSQGSQPGTDICAPNSEFKTAFNWAEQPEPWRSIGEEFTQECRAIVGGVPFVLAASRQEYPLRAARCAKGISASELARRIGCGASQIWRIEAGQVKRSPLIAKIRKELSI
jgi:hypothetical protein